MTDPAAVEAARRLLGVRADADLDEVRRAFRREVRTVHPDRSGAPDAADRTYRLTLAWATLRHHLEHPPAHPPPAAPTRPRTEPPADEHEVTVVDDDTLAVGAPADTTLLLLVEAAHALGDIVYLDPEAGLLEVVVEFLEAPTSSVLVNLQGRANGTTEVMCTVEPLSGGVSPPTDAVVRLLAATLRRAG